MVKINSQFPEETVVIESFRLDRMDQKLDSIDKKLEKTDPSSYRRIVRSRKLSQLLNISESSLQNLRISGILPYKKVGGTLFYDLDEVYAVLDKYSFNQ